MNVSSAGPVGRVGPDARENARPTLSSEAPVLSSPTRPGQRPEKLLASEQRVVLADDAVGGVRAVEPVHADADHRIVDRAELLDRLVRLGRGSPRRGTLARPSFVQRALELLRRLLDVGQRQLVGLLARVAGPEQRDFLLHG